jgi:hypothetical protein
MRQPSDRVALATAGRVLNEIVAPNAFAACGVHQQAHSLKLVVAGEDHRLGLHLAALVITLLVDLQVDEAGQEVEQAVPL